MQFYKRALAIKLGLFLIFLSPLGARDFTESNKTETFSFITRPGTIWVDESGAAVYWYNSLRLAPATDFFLGFDMGHINSNLSWFDGSLFMAGFHFGMDKTWAGFTFTSGFFSHSMLDISADKYIFLNQGGQGIFAKLETRLHFGPLTITPSYLYGEGSWEEGELYWFFGKPKIPFLQIGGLSLSLRTNLLKNELNFNWLSADLTILSNEDILLFDSGIDCGLLYYKGSLEKGNISFNTTLGALFARVALDGGLSSSNQNYFLFPYLDYNVNGSLEFYSGFAFVGYNQKFSLLNYGISVGAFHILGDKGGGEIDYKKKRLFGGGEGIEEVKLNVKGFGAAFMLLDLEFSNLPINAERNKFLSLGIKKVFLLPWGFNNLFLFDSGSASDALPGGIDKAALIRSILLSGLSLHCSISW